MREQIISAWYIYSCMYSPLKFTLKKTFNNHIQVSTSVLVVVQCSA
jgi:hypothetical protein